MQPGNICPECTPAQEKPWWRNTNNRGLPFLTEPVSWPDLLCPALLFSDTYTINPRHHAKPGSARDHAVLNRAYRAIGAGYTEARHHALIGRSVCQKSRLHTGTAGKINTISRKIAGTMQIFAGQYGGGTYGILRRARKLYQEQCPISCPVIYTRPDLSARQSPLWAGISHHASP